MSSVPPRLPPPFSKTTPAPVSSLPSFSNFLCTNRLAADQIHLSFFSERQKPFCMSAHTGLTQSFTMQQCSIYFSPRSRDSNFFNYHQCFIEHFCTHAFMSMYKCIMQDKLLILEFLRQRYVYSNLTLPCSKSLYQLIFQPTVCVSQIHDTQTHTVWCYHCLPNLIGEKCTLFKFFILKSCVSVLPF